ncbi:aminotransferase class I/II-fold pyridoxal phosphate-dependent enzyme [Humidisolicoccus flavus]|uniref:aminotransferase class I/II-fold pyridoxal phosphate-dependent enzyme n=1 Tax=Humidisolicoccus flavus TaxID=3111414 RepID=UPI0032526DF1
MSDFPWQRTARGAGLLGSNGEIAGTIFAEMSALAVSTGAINLGQGFPDEDGPIEVRNAAKQAIDDGVNQYSPGIGHPDLIAAIVEHQKRWYDLDVPSDGVLVTAGATEALTASLLAYLRPGDELIVFEPYYDLYAAIAGLTQATLVPVPVRGPSFLPDLEELRSAFSDRTAMVLVNSPHNPSGSVYPVEVLDEIVRLATEHDALIVTDEVYEHLTFDAPHVPVATRCDDPDRVISISSGGKTFSATGWKIGWITTSKRRRQEIQAVKQYLTYVNGAPFQPAIAAGLRLPDCFFQTAADTLRRKRDILSEGLKAAGFTVYGAQSGYFVLADAAPLGVTDASEFCRQLPAIAGVVGIPANAFTRSGDRSDVRSLVRFAFCKQESVLVEASARLQRAAREAAAASVQ